MRHHCGGLRATGCPSRLSRRPRPPPGGRTRLSCNPVSWLLLSCFYKFAQIFICVHDTPLYPLCQSPLGNLRNFILFAKQEGYWMVILPGFPRCARGAGSENPLPGGRRLAAGHLIKLNRNNIFAQIILNQKNKRADSTVPPSKKQAGKLCPSDASPLAFLLFCSPGSGGHCFTAPLSSAGGSSLKMFFQFFSRLSRFTLMGSTPMNEGTAFPRSPLAAARAMASPCS